MTFTATAGTQAWYDRLPQFLQVLDGLEVDSGDDHPLLRWMSLVGDQLDAVQTLRKRITFIAPGDGGPPTGIGSTSALVDPVTADDAWIPWLAQAVGIDPTLQTVAALRAQIAGGAGYKRGTTGALVAAVQGVLPSPTDPVIVQNDYVYGMWGIYVGVRNADAPDLTAAAAAAESQKPAGCILFVQHGINTWASRQSHYPTWASLPATWDVLEDTA